ncbi:hypothetical protein HBDW_26380 [Herbaspirillum sp. DW155]|uniref:hypothetical protein n=1 Tax=Herbaspirillum sp. DW155 TaxID=3095609 RepID=UPI0030912F1A|nr:hypothetical protein HBDW_26380 [Herbaspirillum sp. DW155]
MPIETQAVARETADFTTASPLRLALPPQPGRKNCQKASFALLPAQRRLTIARDFSPIIGPLIPFVTLETAA